MDKYTKFILTVIAVGILGLNVHLFKDEIISPVHAGTSHKHYTYDLWDFRSEVKNIVKKCMVRGKFISCLPY
jgi:hypothetical protein